MIRWSERAWRGLEPGSDTKIIDLGSKDVPGIIESLLSCRRIASSSLHGLILADAYGIPSAWLMAEADKGGSRPKGGEFKYYDYFASIRKFREPQELGVSSGKPRPEGLSYADGPIVFDHVAFLDSSPFVRRRFPGDKPSVPWSAPTGKAVETREER